MSNSAGNNMQTMIYNQVPDNQSADNRDNLLEDGSYERGSNSMDKLVMLHLLGYGNNSHIDFEDQVAHNERPHGG